MRLMTDEQVRPEVFEHKPTLVRAMHFTEQNRDDVLTWLTDVGCRWWVADSGKVWMLTAQGSKVLRFGDHAVEGVSDGDFYPVRPDTWARSYVPHEVPEPRPDRHHDDD